MFVFSRRVSFFQRSFFSSRGFIFSTGVCFFQVVLFFFKGVCFFQGVLFFFFKGVCFSNEVRFSPNLCVCFFTGAWVFLFKKVLVFLIKEFWIFSKWFGVYWCFFAEICFFFKEVCFFCLRVFFLEGSVFPTGFFFFEQVFKQTKEVLFIFQRDCVCQKLFVFKDFSQSFFFSKVFLPSKHFLLFQQGFFQRGGFSRILLLSGMFFLKAFFPRLLCFPIFFSHFFVLFVERVFFFKVREYDFNPDLLDLY